ncbi:DUF1713 domain-containing protein [Cephalotus follicularis]|uniref:Small ribosomal subunit protein mS38 n=1 Tax=Cephalotus follicularis TaxID=3775 RepID=A0A1Q3CV92_CEPFO|nr:DUF1713 domain-containing protein [Cephalotus follicularis]
MANPILHKLTKHSPSLRIITTTSLSLLIANKTLTSINNTTTNPQNTSDPKPLFNNPTATTTTTADPFQFYPNFPFGYFLNPISSTGSDPFNVVDDLESDGDGVTATVWADSVKKKRKKKMNKHKLRKLRKRLRRKA